MKSHINLHRGVPNKKKKIFDFLPEQTNISSTRKIIKNCFKKKIEKKEERNLIVEI